MVDDIRHPKARACAIWLVGQYSANTAQWTGVGFEGIAEWAPDVLRRTAKTFSAEVFLFSSQFNGIMKVWTDTRSQTPSRNAGIKTSGFEPKRAETKAPGSPCVCVGPI